MKKRLIKVVHNFIEQTDEPSRMPVYIIKESDIETCKERLSFVSLNSDHSMLKIHVETEDLRIPFSSITTISRHVTSLADTKKSKTCIGVNYINDDGDDAVIYLSFPPISHRRTSSFESTVSIRKDEDDYTMEMVYLSLRALKKVNDKET
eukprot:GHVL01004360.1.p1 GENE.GHVL01004360.1~~GHVL01004360.1.p1  ORF type:complete len:150 (-),score=22.09 GHVL01004360.1:88-537(-)